MLYQLLYYLFNFIIQYMIVIFAGLKLYSNHFLPKIYIHGKSITLVMKSNIINSSLI